MLNEFPAHTHSSAALGLAQACKLPREGFGQTVRKHLQTVCGVLLLLTRLDCQSTGAYGHERAPSVLVPKQPLLHSVPEPALLLICISLVKVLGGREEGGRSLF